MSLLLSLPQADGKGEEEALLSHITSNANMSCGLANHIGLTSTSEYIPPRWSVFQMH